MKEKKIKDQIYLLEVLVDKVIQEPDKESEIKGSFRVKVKFSHLPPIEIAEEEFQEKKKKLEKRSEESLSSIEELHKIIPEIKEVKGQDDGGIENKENRSSAIIEDLSESFLSKNRFNKGKSCLFPMNPLELIRTIQRNYLSLYVYHDDPEQLFGMAKISLGSTFLEAVAVATTPPVVLPVSAYMEDAYSLENLFGESTGKIQAFVRLSCFGTPIVGIFNEGTGGPEFDQPQQDLRKDVKEFPFTSIDNVDLPPLITAQEHIIFENENNKIDSYNKKNDCFKVAVPWRKNVEQTFYNQEIQMRTGDRAEGLGGINFGQFIPSQTTKKAGGGTSENRYQPRLNTKEEKGSERDGGIGVKTTQNPIAMNPSSQAFQQSIQAEFKVTKVDGNPVCTCSRVPSILFPAPEPPKPGQVITCECANILAALRGPRENRPQQMTTLAAEGGGKDKQEMVAPVPIRLPQPRSEKEKDSKGVEGGLQRTPSISSNQRPIEKPPYGMKGGPGAFGNDGHLKRENPLSRISLTNQQVNPSHNEGGRPLTAPELPNANNNMSGSGDYEEMNNNYPKNKKKRNNRQNANEVNLKKEKTVDNVNLNLIRKESNGEKKKGRKKHTLYEYTAGMYPGVHIGHRYCLTRFRFVPKSMGWLWNMPDEYLGPRRGWRPGAINKKVADLFREWKRAAGLDIEEEEILPVTKKRTVTKRLRPGGRGGMSKMAASKDTLDPIKPTLHLHKKNGFYYVSMYPVRTDSEDDEEEPQPIQFKLDAKTGKVGEGGDDERSAGSIDDSSDTSTEDSLEIEFTAPSALKRRKVKVLKGNMATQCALGEATIAQLIPPKPKGVGGDADVQQKKEIEVGKSNKKKK